MADPNIQTLIYPMSVGPGIIRTYQTEVNKQTGSSVTYDVTNLGQKDAVWRSEREVDPTSGKVFYRANPVRSSYYENLSDAEKKFIQIDVAYQSDNQRSAFINKNYTPTQRQQLFAGMPKVQHTATPTPPSTPAPSVVAAQDVDEALQKGKGGLNRIEISANYRKTYDNLFYPFDLQSNKQDRIKFTMTRKVGSEIKTTFESGTQTITPKFVDDILGSVTLPIQPSISDSNTVDWSGATLNAIQAYAAAASMQMIGSSNVTDLASQTGSILGKIAKEITGNGDFAQAFKTYFAQEAVGAQNLLSRTSGAILNPNLELLFNGPSLRPFAFTFRLSPRDENEAKQVKKIIRFFKQGMSVKTSASNIFLQSPNIFRLRYITYDNNGNAVDHHPSLNRIKRCALLSCEVDYTPDGTYMTYNDNDKTMTSYQLSLRFSELDPVYDSDYTEFVDGGKEGADLGIGF